MLFLEVRGFDRNSFSLSIFQFLKDIIQSTIGVLNYLIIPVAEHLDAFLLKNSSPILVIFNLVGGILMPAIQLDIRFFSRQ